MKVINETWWEVQQPDGGGMYNEVIAKFTDESEANKYKESLGKGWPRSVEKKTLLIVIYESFEEIKSSQDKKKSLQKQIDELQSQLDNM